MGKEVEDARTSVTLSKAVIKTVLLFGSETWVATPHICRTLGGFNNRFSCCLMITKPRRQPNTRWLYPPLADAMEAVGLGRVKEYITRHQNTSAQYIVMWPILEIWMVTEMMVRSRDPMQWWEKVGIDIMECRKMLEDEEEERETQEEKGNRE